MRSTKSVLSVGVGAVALISASALFWGACSGTSETPESTEVDATPSMVNADLLALSWPMVMTDDALLGAYAGQPAWLALVNNGDIRRATEGMASAGGLSAARMHAEAAAMYKQAALLSATAAFETYGESPRETDALGARHLVVLGKALNGDADGARMLLDSRVQGLSDAAQPFHQAWTEWLGSGEPLPADFARELAGLPEVAVGQWPDLSTDPHYSLDEQVEGSELSVTDPTTLVALGMWHDAAADMAAPDAAAALDVFGARYRFPVEATPSALDDSPMELLFGSDLLTPADAPFLASLLGSEGSAAVDSYADRSLMASLARASRVDGAIAPEKAQDAASEVRAALMDGMVEAAGGNTLPHHRVFADIGAVGVLRALALVAEAEGDHETAGILLISAMDRSGAEYTADPEALLFLSTWDAHNRYPVRGTEILHNLIRRYPNLEAARFGLDALSLRVSRSRGSQNPGL